jgi:hypothetical protein
VPSTNSLPTLTIGFRRAEMTAFWILTSALSSVALGLVATVVGARVPWAWAIAGLCPAVPGLVWPLWFEMGIRAWNKGARLTTAALRSYVLKVSYYLMFGAVSRTGSSLDLRPGQPELSRWIPRSYHDSIDGSHGRRDVDAGNPGTGPRWLAVMRSSRTGGKAWTLCLMPVMLLLLMVRDEAQESAPPSNTYTLF